AASPAPAPAPADPPPPPLSQPSTENTLAQNADAAVIASSLQQAAQTGAPFCAACCKLLAITAASAFCASVFSVEGWESGGGGGSAGAGAGAGEAAAAAVGDSLIADSASS